MSVKDWMNRDVITINVNDAMQAAVKIMKERNIQLKLKEELKKTVQLLYVVELRDNVREFY
jgi:predicted transcriptional regulator